MERMDRELSLSGDIQDEGRFNFGKNNKTPVQKDGVSDFELRHAYAESLLRDIRVFSDAHLERNGDEYQFIIQNKNENAHEEVVMTTKEACEYLNEREHERYIRELDNQTKNRVVNAKKAQRVYDASLNDIKSDIEKQRLQNNIKKQALQNSIMTARDEIVYIERAMQTGDMREVRQMLVPNLSFVAGEQRKVLEEEVKRREEVIRACEQELLSYSEKNSNDFKREEPRPKDNTPSEDNVVEPMHIPSPLSPLSSEYKVSREEDVLDTSSGVDVKDALSEKEQEHFESHGNVSIPDSKISTKRDSQENIVAKTTRESLDFQFYQKFDISISDLETIDGFETLSLPQQKLLYENFVQLTLGNIKEDVAQIHMENVQERALEHRERYGKLLGSAISGIQESVTGTYTKLKEEKKQVHTLKNSGFDTHKVLLTDLVQGMAKYGPRVHETSSGELMVDFVQIRERAQGKEMRDAEWFAMNELNMAAHAYARIPSEWGDYTLGVDTEKDSRIGRLVRESLFRQKDRKNNESHKGAYDTARAQYENAKVALEEILRTSGKNNLEISKMLVDIDMRVHQMQIIQTDPDTLKGIEEISQKNLFLESAKQMVRDSSGVRYFALGFAGRTVLGASFAGFMAAPLVSGALASMRSWDRTAAELREKDRMSRIGAVERDEKTLNIVSVEQVIERTKQRIAQYHRTQSDADRTKSIASIRARVEYVRDKQMLNRINYGNRVGLVAKQVHLNEVLGEAMAILTNEQMIADNITARARYKNISERLTRVLTRTEGDILEARRSYRKQERIRGVVEAAGISLAGALLAQAINVHPVGGKIDTVDSDTSHNLKKIEGLKEIMGEKSLQEAVQENPNNFFEKSNIANTYLIKKGDTLTHIIREQIPEIKNLKTSLAQDNAVANILKSLKPEEMERIGIRSGNVDILNAGENINLAELHKVVENRISYVERSANRFGGHIQTPRK